jgi:mono/diheme cytochrome c family protein
MMYVEDEQEIREWIMDGRPQRLAKKYDAAAPAGAGPPVRMPAYRDLISTGQLDDLVAYFKVVAVFDRPPEEAREGYSVAKRLGCFGCHGPGGLVGVNNPNSFKGYIPPWRGPDFEELVQNEDELRRWILDGAIDRFESRRIARYFMRKQTIRMPGYKNVITEGELEELIRYIDWLQSGE